MSWLQIVSRGLCGAAFIYAGSYHFVDPAIYCKIMPPYIPAPLEMVYISGVFEILGGLGLFLSQSRKIAVWGLIALLVAVFPANINMAMHPELFSKIPLWVLYLRLPLQLVLMFWVWSCRDSGKNTNAKAP